MENLKIISTSDGSSSLLNVGLNETYHSMHGAVQESVHVFIKNGLDHFVKKNQSTSVSIFEVGFGTGLNVLLSAGYSEKNNISINYASIEAFPIDWPMAQRLNYAELVEGTKEKYFFQELHQTTWNEMLSLSENFSLHKIHDRLQSVILPTEQFDVIYFDAFAPAKQPELWTREILEKIFLTMKSGGIFVTYCAKGQLKRDLKSLGLLVESLSGPPGKREMIRATKHD